METKIGGTGLDPRAFAAMEKVFKEQDGDFSKIGNKLGINFKPGASAKDGKEFAQKMLTGAFFFD